MFFILYPDFFLFVDTGSWIRTHRGATFQSRADTWHCLVNNLPALGVKYKYQWPWYLHCSSKWRTGTCSKSSDDNLKSTKGINSQVFTFQLKRQAELPQSCKKRGRWPKNANLCSTHLSAKDTCSCWSGASAWESWFIQRRADSLVWTVHKKKSNNCLQDHTESSSQFWHFIKFNSFTPWRVG